MAESIEQLGYALTTDELAEQERALARLRTCAGTVLGAASIAASFLGARTRDGSLGVCGATALASFVFCLGSSVWVLLPHEFVFAFGARELRAEADRGMRDVVDAYRVVARWIEPDLQANRVELAKLANWLTLSCLFLTAEIILWTLSLVG
jgi:hypothetical protein